MLCPVCEQGTIVRATVKELGDTVYICDECEALWEAGEPIDPESVGSLSGYLSSRRPKDDWSELTEIDENWSPASDDR